MKSRKPPCPRSLLSVDDLARTAKTLKLLSHPCRLRIIERLESDRAAPVHRLTEELGLPQAAVSSHLTKLLRAELVQRERRGKEVWYSLGDPRSLAILNCMRARKRT